MNETSPYQPWLHRLAVLTACLALLPLVVGALVTTRDAGMAFPDWPSSDGHSLFGYPWLESAGEKFLEHGHRLAGALIGLVSIALAAVAWWVESRRWVKWLAVGVLLGVIGQGILGGQRVLWNDRSLAFLHGGVAACVFSLMATLALVTSRSWFQIPAADREREVEHLKFLAGAIPLVVLGQYLLGGMIRHWDTGLYEHLGMAAVVVVVVTAGAVGAYCSRVNWLRRPALWLLVLLAAQVLLGAGAWITRFGLAWLGYVAVHNAPVQVVVRTAHTVVGMLLLMSSVIYALRVFRLDSLQRAGSVEPTAAELPAEAARLGNVVSVKGGVR